MKNQDGKNLVQVIRNILLIAILFLGVTECYSGRADKAGTASASELLIPVGARSIALGGADLASVAGVEALFWNPSGIVRSPYSLSVTASHMTYLADISVQYFALVTGMNDFGTIGLSVKSLSIGEIPITTSDQPDGTGEYTSPTFLVLGGTFARRITDKISFGLTGNFLIEKMEQVSANGIAFTGGLQYSGLGGIDNLDMGVIVRNLGPAVQFEGEGLVRKGQIEDVSRPSADYLIDASEDELPSTIEIGFTYKWALDEENMMKWSGAFENNNFSADEYKFGVEYNMQTALSFRGGYTFSSDDENGSYIFGPSFGLGIHTQIEAIFASFDYTYRTVSFFDNSHCLTLILGF